MEIIEEYVDKMQNNITDMEIIVVFGFRRLKYYRYGNKCVN